MGTATSTKWPIQVAYSLDPCLDGMDQYPVTMTAGCASDMDRFSASAASAFRVSASQRAASPLTNIPAASRFCTETPAQGSSPEFTSRATAASGRTRAAPSMRATRASSFIRNTGARSPIANIATSSHKMRSKATKRKRWLAAGFADTPHVVQPARASAARCAGTASSRASANLGTSAVRNASSEWPRTRSTGAAGANTAYGDVKAKAGYRASRCDSSAQSSDSIDAIVAETRAR